MIKSIPLFKIEQPIGDFFVGKIDTKTLLKMYIVKNRSETSNIGYQRGLDSKRVKDIEEYIKDPDAIFPTAIIIAIKSSDVTLESSDLINGAYILRFDDDKKDLMEIIDGQHRLLGIRNNPELIKELPIIILFDLSEEQKAYVFSTINSNQRKVSNSLIYDLFELYETRSPGKTCHEIAKTFNNDRKSPFYRRLKMLGRKVSGDESISQGSFANYVLELITNNAQQDSLYIKKGKPIKELDTKKYVLREWFDKREDDKIYKVLLNYFAAVSHIFYKEWEDPNKYVLRKTTGFGALCKSFAVAFNKGVEKGELSLTFFEKLFTNSKEELYKQKKKITSDYYGSGEAEQKKLMEDFISVW